MSEKYIFERRLVFKCHTAHKFCGQFSTCVPPGGAGALDLKLSYLTYGAQWSPSYDCRAVTGSATVTATAGEGDGEGEGQGLTLAHFSAEPELFMTQNAH